MSQADIAFKQPVELPISLSKVNNRHVLRNGVVGDQSVNPRLAAVPGGVVCRVLAPLLGNIIEFYARCFKHYFALFRIIYPQILRKTRE